MGIASKYRSFKEKADYAFTSPDCRECGEWMNMEKSSVKPDPDELGGRAWRLAVTSFSVMGIGVVGFIGGLIGVGLYGETSMIETILAASMMLMGTGFLGLVTSMPLNEYYTGRIARDKLEEHPVCYSCLKEENRGLWMDQGEETHLDFH